MKAYIIYFSGTGNTEYVAEAFKKNFEKNNIEAELINIVEQKEFKYDAQYYVFACPTHIEVCPSIFVEWIRKIKKVVKKECIVVSTEAAKSSGVPKQLSKILTKKGFDVVSTDFIMMPNNFYVVHFKENTKQEIKELKENALEKVKNLTTNFLNKNTSKQKINGLRLAFGQSIYKVASKFYLRKWASRNLTVDYEKCTKCGKCQELCPTGNITIEEDKIKFNDKCIACQKCIHSCPNNAFMYKGKHFSQYKL